MTLLEKANAALKDKRYEEAISLYEKVVKNKPEVANIADFNLRYARNKIEKCSPAVHAEKRNVAALVEEETQKEIYEGNLEVCKDNFLKGWAVQKGKPSAIFDLTIYINDISFCKIKNDKYRNDLIRHKKSTGRGGFSFNLPEELSLIDVKSLELKYPNDELFCKLPIPEKGKSSIFNCVQSIENESVSIIVPIYNAASDLKICIERLINYTSDSVDIILIDDASPDLEIKLILNEAKKYENIRVFENKDNLGFTRTINRGIELAGENDVVFLNSDARVTPKWLEGLKAALASDPKIATVTPMSDRAGAFSAPDIGNENVLPEGVTEENYAIAFRRRSIGLYPKVPTGNGFCLYVRRKCINEIGPLDAKAFPRGYGEENDFCMRALRSGWFNIIDDRTYVFHDRSKSFGEAKTDLMKAGRAVVDERYPEYKFAIKVYNIGKEIALARYCARLAIQDCVSNQKVAGINRILFVIATQTGGTPQTNRDLMEALSDVFEGWVLRCDSEVIELSFISDSGKKNQIIRSHQLQEPVNALTHYSSEYDKIVSNWLKSFDFNLVHIRHLGWHSLSLPRLSKNLGVKVVYSFHDYYALSSHFKLIDDKGQFLGNDFIEEGSIYRESLWQKDALPTPYGNWLNFWRERFQAALEYCDAFVTTADSARSLILNVMPKLSADRFLVIPHGRDFPCFHRIREKPKKGERLRILVPGHINAVKGLEVIRALVDHDKDERLEFYILGRLIGEAPKKGIVTLGAYERHEFADKASVVRPHIGIMFSIWDETYCHTLTELWSVGLPVAVLDFPNVADRVRSSGAGWVLDHNNIAQLYENILRIAFDDQEYTRTEQALTNWQAGYGLANSTVQMSAGYLAIYSAVLRGSTIKPQSLSPQSRKRIAVVSPASFNIKHVSQNITPILEKTRNSIDRDITYIKMSPTMLVASSRNQMIDGAIIQGEVKPSKAMDNLLMELSISNTPYLLNLEDNIIDQTLPKFDMEVMSLLNVKSGVKKKIPNSTYGKKNIPKARVAVFVHIFYIHRWDITSHYLCNINLDFDLFISCPEDHLPSLKKIIDLYPNVKVVPTENRGMDVLPFLNVVRDYELWNYDAVLKLHTKNDKSEIGKVLGEILLEGVLGTKELVDKVLKELFSNNEIGMVGPECMYRSAPKLMKPNQAKVERILGAIPTNWPREEWGFIAGTMFWIHGSLLEKLMTNYDGIVNDVYIDDNIAFTGGDGSWAHAMERVFGLLPKLSGKNIAVSYPSNAECKHTHIRKLKHNELSFNRITSRRSSYYVFRYQKLSEWAGLCRESEFFDEDYYRAKGGELVPSEMDAAAHFILFGDVLELDPSSKFSTKKYLKNNLDIANLNPSMPSLVHFLKFGQYEGRVISEAI